MANTFELIASSTVGASSVSSIDFTSIPSTFTDLCLKISGRTDRSNVADQLKISFNGSTTTYSGMILLGYGTGVLSETNSAAGAGSGYLIGENTNGASSTANTFSNGELYIPNYAGSTNKSISMDLAAENNASTSSLSLTAGLWATTSAITSIKLQSANGFNFVQYSTAYLYGVKNA
jgi:hypothetical protein